MNATIQLNLPLTFKQLAEAIQQLPANDKQQLLSFLLKELVSKQDESKTTLTHFASEKSLGKDWLTPEEDEAWQTL